MGSVENWSEKGEGIHEKLISEYLSFQMLLLENIVNCFG